MPDLRKRGTEVIAHHCACPAAPWRRAHPKHFVTV